MEKYLRIFVAVGAIALIVIIAMKVFGPRGINETKENGIVIKDLVLGKGAEAVPGKNIKVHYVGTLENGREFDNSIKRKQPFTFPLGAGRVIKGWDLGFEGMRVGGKRKLTIPGDLAYGEKGAGDVIPPDATLIFEVELLDVEK
jgi:FKBP-type peptidyl-prolyl cis-trans isomerase FkpA